MILKDKLRGLWTIMKWAPPSHGNNMKGVALLVVLITTFLLSAILVSLITSQQLDIRRSANMIHSQKASILARAVCDWVAVLLKRDLKQSSTDHLAEEWAHDLQPTSFKEGVLTGTVIDLQSRLNLNNLMAEDENFRNHSRAQFTRMLDMCRSEADTINAVLDWLDDDSQTRTPGGAEDAYYLSLHPPYVAANRFFTDISELRLVAGISTVSYQCLSPNLSALPHDTYINVNTASPFVLAAISDNFSLRDAEELVAKRPRRGYGSVSRFFQQPLIVEKHYFGPFLTVASHYFQADVTAELGNARIRMYTVLERQNGVVIPLYSMIVPYF